MDAEVRRKQLAAAIRRVAGGDRAALRLVYDATAAKLFGVCLRILHDRTEAEDVLQEVYLTVWRKASAFDEARASPITWLVAIARNRAIDRARGSGAARLNEPIEAAESVADPAPLAAETVEAMQESTRLYSCLDELEARAAKAIRAAFLDGLTYEQLAARENVPLGTMKSWIRRGLAGLRECLETMSDNGDIAPAGNALTAAEYVLGVLDAAERRAAERRISLDAVFAREVAFWEEKLGALAETVEPAEPPAGAWARIEAAIDRTQSADAERRGIWNNLPLWRGLAFAASTLAAACIAALVYVGSVAPPAPLLARLDAESGQAGFVAAVSPGGTTLTIVPASLLTADQQAMELWLIPDGEKPHSLGLIDPDRPVTITVPEDLVPKISTNAVLAVSLEPPGGSPTGQPTGPVIANGKLAAL